MSNTESAHPTNVQIQDQTRSCSLPGVAFQANFRDGAYLQVIGTSEEEFDVQILDKSTNKCVFKCKLKCGMWARTKSKFFRDYQIVVKRANGDIAYQHDYDPAGKTVFVPIVSKQLGDTIAWMPYVEEFRKKWNCHVICSTSFNKLFQSVYPEIEFRERDTYDHTGAYACYRMGWYDDSIHNPNNARTRPLQASAADILGIDFAEMRPRLAFTPGPRPLAKKYVCIATAGMGRFKMWNHPGGWASIVALLKIWGYEVVSISREGFTEAETIQLGKVPMPELMNWIHHSELVIGLSSGLSWLSWALRKHVVMISNFTVDGHEFVEDCTRITNVAACHGCWNDTSCARDHKDWNWCPRLKGTERMFECHTSITPEMVADRLEPLLRAQKFEAPSLR